MGTCRSFLCSATLVIAVSLAVMLAGCSPRNAGVLATPGTAATPAAPGVSLEQFTVTRYNAEGRLDSALNRTLSLAAEAAGELVALTISVSEPQPCASVTLDVNYDARQWHPVYAEFCGLLGAQDEVVRGAFLDSCPGIAGLGEVRCGGQPLPGAEGRFATLYLAAGPPRSTSSNMFSAHSSLEGVSTMLGEAFSSGYPTLTASAIPAEGTAQVKWYAGWDTGDGDQNNEVNVADLVPIGNKWHFVPASDFSALPADYDNNNEVSISDLTPIGRFFKECTNSYLVTVSDDTTGAPRTTVGTLAWGDAQPAVGPATYGVLGSVFQSWVVDFGASTPVTMSDLAALDVGGGSGAVRVFITPQEDFYPPASTGTEASILVSTAPLNAAPEIASAVFDEATDTLTVTVSDADGDPLTVSVTQPAGLAVDATSKPATGGSAQFIWTATNPAAGGDGETTITVDDGHGGTDTMPLQITVAGLADDTLYVIPQDSAVFVSQPVRIVVATGRTANPFQFLNACHITVEAVGQYVADSFNVGAPGGDPADGDGAWNAMPAANYLIPPDSFIEPADIGSGRVGYNFNITPIGGSDQTNFVGDILNFELKFDAPGTYRLGIQDDTGDDRTYYSDAAAAEYQWSMLMANELGMMSTAITGYSNEIVVTYNPNNHAPVIESVSYDEPTSALSVTVSDQDGDDVRVGITPPAGLAPDFPSLDVAGGNGTAVFYWAAEDPVAGGSGTAAILAQDTQGGSDSDNCEITIGSIPINDDTLYVLPLNHHAKVGQPVRCYVYTGATAHPFLYLNGVGITSELGTTYVPDTYNVGFLGGTRLGIDGAWTQLSPLSIMGFDDAMIVSSDITGGRLRYDFTVVPLGGGDFTGLRGYLFNLAFSFEAPGLYHLGLQESEGVKRTYYSDGIAVEHNWGTLMADELGTFALSVSGVDNTVTVE